MPNPHTFTGDPELSMASPEDNIAYTEIHKVFELLQSIEEENNIIDGSKIENKKTNQR